MQYINTEHFNDIFKASIGLLMSDFLPTLRRKETFRNILECFEMFLRLENILECFYRGQKMFLDGFENVFKNILKHLKMILKHSKMFPDIFQKTF